MECLPVIGVWDRIRLTATFLTVGVAFIFDCSMIVKPRRRPPVPTKSKSATRKAKSILSIAMVYEEYTNCTNTYKKKGDQRRQASKGTGE